LRIQHNGERIAAEGSVGEDVDSDVAPLHGLASFLRSGSFWLTRP
jgi:hypothetical protein